jgi:1-acyl-sn-glycerol-3-phosphate acyltransferase
VTAFRSFLFNLAFYLVLFVYLIAAMPTLLMPRRALIWMVKSWSCTNFWLLRVICSIRMDIAGRERIPHGAVLVASKHQSLWETFALMTVFEDPAYVLKRELMWIPFFGWCARKAEMIPVDRGAGSQALTKMTDNAKQEAARGRQIIIFPEGTRRAPGAEPKYKFGVAHLYSELGIPCVPVALNSGLFWPRRSFMRYPGTIRVEILDPIPPGLDKQDFVKRLQEDVERATARLVAEGQHELELAGVTRAV